MDPICLKMGGKIYREGANFETGLFCREKFRGGEFRHPWNSQSSQLPHAQLNVRAHAPFWRQKDLQIKATESSISSPRLKETQSNTCPKTAHKLWTHRMQCHWHLQCTPERNQDSKYPQHDTSPKLSNTIPFQKNCPAGGLNPGPIPREVASQSTQLPGGWQLSGLIGHSARSSTQHRNSAVATGTRVPYWSDQCLHSLRALSFVKGLREAP